MYNIILFWIFLKLHCKIIKNILSHKILHWHHSGNHFSFGSIETGFMWLGYCGPYNVHLYIHTYYQQCINTNEIHLPSCLPSLEKLMKSLEN